MSKKNKNNGNRNGEFKIPKDVTKSFLATFKKWKKENDFYSSKKDAKKAFYLEKLDVFGHTVIPLLIRYGYRSEVNEIRNSLYEVITEPDFVKVTYKAVDKGDGFENMILYPIIVQDIAEALTRQCKAESTDDQTKVIPDVDDLLETSKEILAKRLKKAKKMGIDEATAYSCLSIIPTVDILDIKNDDKSRKKFYIYRRVLTAMYTLAKDKPMGVKVDDLIEFVFRKGEEYIPTFVACVILEKKERQNSMTETQKALFNELTTWAFNKLETFDKETINLVLNLYLSVRKEDDGNNRDSARRFYISSLPENEYPKTLAAMKKIVERSEDNKKYF